MSDSIPEHEVSPTASGRRAWWSWMLPVVVAVAFGVLGGLGVFTFGYGEGYAYLSDNPEGCINCHVMQDQYDSWMKSSHHAVAVCNDCHAPHHSIFAKYLNKADNGFFHSLAFTTDDFKDPIQIKERNSRVVVESCVHCHKDLVHHLLPSEAGGDMLSCTHCHSNVGHALSISPRRHEGY